MSNPRKFSEKIALHTQKQAEETSAFEQIMREVQTVTTAPQPRDQSPAARQPQPHLLHAMSNASFIRGGSLPNVNQIAQQRGDRTPTRHLGQLSTSPRASQNKLGPIRGSQKTRADHAPYASPPSLSHLNTMTLGGGTSPNLCAQGAFANFLLPPVESPYRRANSDSAINSINSLMIPSVVPDSSEESSNNSNDPRDNYGLSSIGLHSKPQDVPGALPTMVGDGSSLLEIPTSISTGSLPDLTTFHFPTQIQQPAEIEDPHNNTSPYSTSPLSMTYSHSPTSCSPHSQQQPTVTGNLPQQGQQVVPQHPHGLSQQQQQPQLKHQQQQQVQHQQSPRSPIPHHQQHQHQSLQQSQQQHSPQQNQQQHSPQQNQQQHSPQQNQQQHSPQQNQQQHSPQQNQQQPSTQPQQHQHSPQQAQQQHHPNSSNPLLDKLSINVNNTSFQQTFTTNENMLTAYRCPPRPSPQNSPSPFRSPSPHDGQLSAPPSPSNQPQSADSFFLSQQANALQHHFEQISMVDGTPQRNNNGHWQQGGGMVNNIGYFYNSGQQQIGATAGVTTQQSPSHHQPQTPQTPSSIPDIIFTDCTDPLEDFLTSEAAAAAFREGLGPIDTGDFQLLSGDPNLVPDPQVEDTFRLDRL